MCSVDISFDNKNISSKNSNSVVVNNQPKEKSRSPYSNKKLTYSSSSRGLINNNSNKKINIIPLNNIRPPTRDNTQTSKNVLTDRSLTSRLSPPAKNILTSSVSPKTKLAPLSKNLNLPPAKIITNESTKINRNKIQLKVTASLNKSLSPRGIPPVSIKSSKK